MANNQKTPAPPIAAPAPLTELARLEATRAELAAQAVALHAEAADLTLPAARMIDVRTRLSAIQGAIRDIDREAVPARRREILAKADACDRAAKDASDELAKLRAQGYPELERFFGQFLYVGIGPHTTDAQIEEAVDKIPRYLRMAVAVERARVAITSNCAQAAAWRESAANLVSRAPIQAFA